MNKKTLSIALLSIASLCFTQQSFSKKFWIENNTQDTLTAFIHIRCPKKKYKIESETIDNIQPNTQKEIERSLDGACFLTSLTVTNPSKKITVPSPTGLKNPKYSPAGSLYFYDTTKIELTKDQIYPNIKKIFNAHKTKFSTENYVFRITTNNEFNDNNQPSKNEDINRFYTIEFDFLPAQDLKQKNDN